MEKFMTLLQEKLTPIANFCGTERHFASMQKGFMSAISFILVSAVFMILANPPVTADLVAQGGFWSVFGPWLDFATANKLTLLIPFNMTMGILSVIVTFAIAYNLAGTYKMPKLNAGMTSLVMFLIAAAPSSYYQLADESVLQAVPCTYLGAQGLFTAIIVALVSVEVTRFCQTKGITIKMPDGVPPFLSETFGAIVPMLANILIFFGGNLLIQMIDPTLSIPSVIEKLLAAPLSVAVDSVPGALLICFMTLLFWCFGVHGNMIVMPITAPVTLAAFAANASLYAAGQPLEFHPVLMSMVINLIGGTGNTFSFVALCAFKAKSQQLKAFGRASIVPSFFRISEPAIFGAPIIFNPILMIPFVLGGMISALLYWGAISLGLVSNFYILVSGTFPIFVQGFIQCLDPRIWVFTIVLIVVMAVVWYPFFKVYDNQLLAQEQENAAAASAKDTE